ncbi:MAG: hypothetical protein QM752_01805 [Gammaproteobacteria bacterium]
MKIGILALQGGYQAHAKMLDMLGIAWAYIRQPAELSDIQGLILPGEKALPALSCFKKKGCSML